MAISLLHPSEWNYLLAAEIIHGFPLIKNIHQKKPSTQILFQCLLLDLALISDLLEPSKEKLNPPVCIWKYVEHNPLDLFIVTWSYLKFFFASPLFFKSHTLLVFFKIFAFRRLKVEPGIWERFDIGQERLDERVKFILKLIRILALEPTKETFNSFWIKGDLETKPKLGFDWFGSKNEL